MRQPDGDVFPFLDPAVGAHLDVRRDFDRPSVEVEEPEAVAPAGRLERVRLGDERDALACQPLGQLVNRLAVGGAVRHQVKALVAGPAHADDVLLR